MERLTKYDEFGNAELVGIDNTKLYERLVCDETVALTIATNKLGELEDVLEKYGIETTEELDRVLKPLIDNGELENWKSAIFWKMQAKRLKRKEEVLAKLEEMKGEKDE